MNDVWFNLDLSSPASFHGMLAYAASYSAYIRGVQDCPLVIRHKIQAITMANERLSNPSEALSDESFAAVLRLLALEVPIFSLLCILFLAFLINADNQLCCMTFKLNIACTAYLGF
jgi:hypothetical protein